MVNTSDWFAAALRNDKLGGEPGVLKFPEDSVDTWKWLLAWIFYNEVPQAIAVGDCEAIQLVHCWCLGEKYTVPAFQDAIMVELINLNDIKGPLQLQAVKDAFENSAPGSPLRTFMTEWVAELLGPSGCTDVTYEDLDFLDGVDGFASAIAKALDDCDPAQDENVDWRQRFMVYGEWSQR